MPRYAQGPDLSSAMARLADALGANRARLSIIQFLRDHPGANRTTVTRSLGIGHQTVYSHLLALEAAGVVYTDAGHDRHGRVVHYWLDREELLDQLAAVVQEFQE